jgi:PTH1 family peptidyl-tRNA hydrolase
MKFVIVLLGNKGEVYSHTRHNAGRVLFDEVKTIPEGFDVLVPSGFMNESGLDVARYMRYHEMVEPLVVYDDKDIEIGKMKLAFDRGDGGHNGLKSVIQCLGRTDFLRLRVGIAPQGTDGREVLPPHGDAVQKYVMATFREDEKEKLATLSLSIPELLVMIRDHGYHKAMEVYNGR